MGTSLSKIKALMDFTYFRLSTKVVIIPRSYSTVLHLTYNKELFALFAKMVVDKDITIISFYMRDATYERSSSGGEVSSNFIPMEYKFEDFGKMAHKIPDYIMKLRYLIKILDQKIPVVMKQKLFYYHSES